MALVSLWKVRGFSRQSGYLCSGSRQCRTASLSGSPGSQITLLFSMSLCTRMCSPVICVLLQQPPTSQAAFSKLCFPRDGLREPTVLDTLCVRLPLLLIGCNPSPVWFIGYLLRINGLMALPQSRDRRNAGIHSKNGLIRGLPVLTPYFLANWVDKGV